jgi:hypothetical protein
MDWISVVAYGVSGALGALFASLIVGNKKERRVIYLAVLVATMYGVHALAARFVLPSVYGWQVDRQIRHIALYSEIAESDPQTYEKLKEVVSEGASNGESAGAIESKILPIAMATLPRYVPKASDQSVITFISLTTSELKELNGTDSDACYQFLFPQKFPSAGVAAQDVDDTTKNRLLQAMADVVQSATHDPQPLPDRYESEALLKPISNELAQKYGTDIFLLQNTPKDQAERGKLCSLVSDLYERVLKLPPRQSSEVLRDMFSGQ